MQKTHSFIHFFHVSINLFVHSFAFCILFHFNHFTVFQLTGNSYKQIDVYSHVLFSKLPPRRVPGTPWQDKFSCLRIHCQFIRGSSGSQTSESMDRGSNTGGKRQRRERVRREEVGRETLSGKKVKVRENVKSREALYFSNV